MPEGGEQRLGGLYSSCWVEGKVAYRRLEGRVGASWCPPQTLSLRSSCAAPSRSAAPLCTSSTPQPPLHTHTHIHTHAHTHNHHHQYYHHPRTQEVSEAWEVRWPSLPDLGRLGSPTKRVRPAAAGAGAGPAAGGAGRGALQVDTAALQALVRLWRQREAAAGAGGR